MDNLEKTVLEYLYKKEKKGVEFHSIEHLLGKGEEKIDNLNFIKKKLENNKFIKIIQNSRVSKSIDNPEIPGGIKIVLDEDNSKLYHFRIETDGEKYYEENYKPQTRWDMLGVLVAIASFIAAGFKIIIDYFV